MKQKLLPLPLLAASLCALTPTETMAATVVTDWDKVALQAIRDTHPGPPMVARMLAITHTCIYDAWAAYDNVAVGTRLGGILRRPSGEHTDANKDEAISYAAHRCLADLFPSQHAVIDNALAGRGYSLVPLTTPALVGVTAAQAVIDFRHNDGSNQLGTPPYSDTTGYTPANSWNQINDPNRWQPLRVPDGHGGFAIQKFIGPHWENVVPFALASADQFDGMVPGPYLYGTKKISPSGQYVKQVEEILKYSADLTDEQKVIAEYWADGPASELPPGHWALFGQFVSERDHHSIDDDAKMFFALQNGIFDASIVSWHLKRKYDSVRPVTAVHFLKGGKPVRAWAGPYLGTKIIDGANWQPYQAATVVTPPFPEYLSGHSIFSRTGAEILTAFTGSPVFGASVTVAAGSSRVEPGMVPAGNIILSWPTFKDAADQAGISRRYGGIHFVAGDLDARALGPVIAAQAWDKAQTYFNGTAQ